MPLTILIEDKNRDSELRWSKILVYPFLFQICYILPKTLSLHQADTFCFITKSRKGSHCLNIVPFAALLEFLNHFKITLNRNNSLISINTGAYNLNL